MPNRAAGSACTTLASPLPGFRAHPVRPACGPRPARRGSEQPARLCHRRPRRTSCLRAKEAPATRGRSDDRPQLLRSSGVRMRGPGTAAAAHHGKRSEMRHEVRRQAGTAAAARAHVRARRNWIAGPAAFQLCSSGRSFGASRTGCAQSVGVARRDISGARSGGPAARGGSPGSGSATIRYRSAARRRCGQGRSSSRALHLDRRFPPGRKSAHESGR